MLKLIIQKLKSWKDQETKLGLSNRQKSETLSFTECAEDHKETKLCYV